MRNTIVSFFAILVAGSAGCVVQESGGSIQQAAIVSPDLVISQVYGGGGNSGSTLKNDYVVLFNRGGSAASLSGLHLYYEPASAAGNEATTKWNAGVALPAVSLAPGESYLVSEQGGSSGTTALPTADTIDNTLNFAAASGQVALAGAQPTNDPASWIDMVGWGGAVLSETAAAPATSTTTALFRAGGGCTDTGDNSKDFTAATAAPVNSVTSMPYTACEIVDAGPPDLTSGPDMVVLDAGAYTAALNEVKFNPAGNDNGEEFIELIGTGTLPPHTMVLSVSGDMQTGFGKINYALDVSITPFGSNGLILVKATTTTFPGVPAATTIVNDANLEIGKLGNFTETAVLAQVDNPALFKTGLTIPTTGYTILDSIAVREPLATGGTLDPIIGTAVLEACPNAAGKLFPPSGASRVVGDSLSESANQWYAGQAVGLNTDQYLNDVAGCSTAHGAPQTWSMSPGLPNNMPTEPAPDLAVGPDMAHAVDGGDVDDLSGDDLSGSVGDMTIVHTGGPQDLSHTTTYPSKGGCSLAGRAAPMTSFWVLALLGLPVLLRRRRRA